MLRLRLLERLRFCDRLRFSGRLRLRDAVALPRERGRRDCDCDDRLRLPELLELEERLRRLREDELTVRGLRLLDRPPVERRERELLPRRSRECEDPVERERRELRWPASLREDCCREDGCEVWRDLRLRPFAPDLFRRVTSLLKLLRSPRAVSSCTMSARLLSSNFSSHSSQPISESDCSPL
jgi:hypothetical protein